jgi:hypothetical protein
MSKPKDTVYRYRSFVSYSRADRASAKMLQTRLERYILQRALRSMKPGVRYDRRSLRPIFRDEDDLVPGHDLPTRIRLGLEQSDFLVVVCSPRATASEWVDKEIRDFVELGRQNNILAVVVDGEPDASARGLAPNLECLPAALRFELDLRDTEDGQTVVEVSGRPATPFWLDWRKPWGAPLKKPRLPCQKLNLSLPSNTRTRFSGSRYLCRKTLPSVDSRSHLTFTACLACRRKQTASRHLPFSLKRRAAHPRNWRESSRAERARHKKDQY